jgi:hypothetical protein
MRFERILASVLIAATATVAHASGAGASELLQDCTYAQRTLDQESVNAIESMRAGRCSGTIWGVLGAMSLYSDAIEPGYKACLPNGLGGEQAVRMMLKWLRDHPEHLGDVQAVAVVSAFRDYYPCPSPPQGK